MYKYYTKMFTDFAGVDDEIDKWLRSFERDVPASEGNCAKIEGYAYVNDRIVITVSRWEVQK